MPYELDGVPREEAMRDKTTLSAEEVVAEKRARTDKSGTKIDTDARE